jgi:hypothetical protein
MSKFEYVITGETRVEKDLEYITASRHSWRKELERASQKRWKQGGMNLQLNIL